MMLGKIFALAGVVSVAGLAFAAGVSGCSSDVDASSAADAKADRTPVSVDDAGASDLCYSDEALDATKLSYNAPNVQPGACTEANITDLVAFIKNNTTPTYDEILAHVKATYAPSCAACVSSDTTASTWAPILTIGGSFSEENSGSCYQLVSGSSDCGKAYYQWHDCVDFACQSCGDQTSYDDCRSAVQSTACAAATDAVIPACGGALALSAYVKKCSGEYGIDAWIRQSCVVGGSLADAGDDAGDAGDGGSE